MRRSPFHRQIDRDFMTSFLNDAEFGQVCEWNGGKLYVAEAATDSISADEAMGIIHNKKRIFCRSKDLSRLPQPDDDVVMNGVRWRVVDSKRMLGHFEILLERYVGA